MPNYFPSWMNFLWALWLTVWIAWGISNLLERY